MPAKSTGLLLAGAAALLLLAGCGGLGEHRYEVQGDTFRDFTYDCSIRVPNTKWEFKPVHEETTDAILFLYVKRFGIDAIVALGVSKHPQENLEAFAAVGVYNPREESFTFVDGQPSNYFTKEMDVGGYKFTNKGYKFVAGNRGYALIITYPRKLDNDPLLQGELNAMLNTFRLGKPASGFSSASATPSSLPAADKPRLDQVGMLEIVDLQGGQPTPETKSLTDLVQDQAVKTNLLRFVERRSVGAIVKEHDFQTGMVKGATAAEVGKLLGARYLLSGNLGRVGGSSVLYLQLTEVQTGEVLATASASEIPGVQGRLGEVVPVLVQRLSERLQGRSGIR